MNRSLSGQNFARPLLVAILMASLAIFMGCERSPEDLEEWRTARGGLEQISEWAQDDSESMEVRERGVQILVEEGATIQLRAALEGIDNAGVRQQLADAAMPTVQRMWDVQDFPRLSEEVLEEGGTVVPEGDEAIRAVEALYQLMPYLTGEQQEAGQAILRDWISDDQVARTQWADVAIPLLVPMAGEGAMELVTNWIMESRDPRAVVRSLRRHAPDDGHTIIDRTVAERAKKKHPDIDNDMKHVINGAQSAGIIPYLEEVMLDEASSDQLYQIAIDTVVEVLEEDAAEVLAKAVEQRQGIARWTAATNILDARGVAGLIDIASALPDDADAYGDDEFNRRATYLCNYVNTHLERGDFDADPTSIGELLTTERWTAQALGLQCAARIEATELLEAIQGLSDEQTAIAAWGQDLTVGQFADAVSTRLQGDDEE